MGKVLLWLLDRFLDESTTQLVGFTSLECPASFLSATPLSFPVIQITTLVLYRVAREKWASLLLLHIWGSQVLIHTLFPHNREGSCGDSKMWVNRNVFLPSPVHPNLYFFSNSVLKFLWCIFQLPQGLTHLWVIIYDCSPGTPGLWLRRSGASYGPLQGPQPKYVCLLPDAWVGETPPEAHGIGAGSHSSHKVVVHGCLPDCCGAGDTTERCLFQPSCS